MSVDKRTLQPAEATARREFLSHIGKASITAPAVAILLAATAGKVSAQYQPPPDPGEDF